MPDATQYDSMKGLLSAKSRGALPRGTKFKIEKGDVVFTSGKGTELLRTPLADYAEGALKREGFRGAD